MKRPILTTLLSVMLLSSPAWAQKRKDLHGKSTQEGVRIEHPEKKEGVPAEHASGTSKKAKLEQGTREAHPPKPKSGVESEHHKTGADIHRKGSKQGHYKKPVKKD